MGMDVYGKKPSSETGKYFRNNCWWWRPLWDYCCEVAPELIDAQLAKAGHYNDGKGLNAARSVKLAARLQEEIDAGRTEQYARERAATLEAMPSESCEICGGTGKRAVPPKTGPGKQPCNGCEASGWRRPWDTSYPFDVDNVREFIAFLRDCGGFKIH